MRRLLANCTGAAAVESALVLPLAMLLLLGLVELGRVAWTQSALNFAVQEAARCASVTPGTCGSSSQIAAYAAGKAQGVGATAANFSSVRLACGVQITASVPYRFLAFRVFPTAPTIQARTCRI